MKNYMTEEWIDVSHSIGIPFGGIGTGYCAFGKHGFVNVNFDSIPDSEQTKVYPEGDLWQYDRDPKDKQDFALLLSEKDRKLLLQQKNIDWLPEAECVSNVSSYALLPKGYFVFDTPGWDLDISALAFSPMNPHDIENSTIPVLIFEISIKNNSQNIREFDLSFINNLKAEILSDKNGEIGFSSAEKVVIKPGEKKKTRLYLSWYYPVFNLDLKNVPDDYTRYYTKRFSNTSEIIALAYKETSNWEKMIDQWHDSFNVPAYFKRFWFSSLSSVISSTLMSDDPYFFELEKPHPIPNTMDVCVYSSWVYLINWPELEHMDIKQYFKAMPTEGPDKGFVWHSLWNESADYVEEPIFGGRVYRDMLWFGDKKLLKEAFDKCLMSTIRVYNKDNMDYLIVSKKGNQSYDGWMMPGVSAYVNTAWIYTLYSLEKMANILGEKVEIDGIPLKEFKQKAIDSLNRLLWNKEAGCFDCFYRTPGACEYSIPNSIFTDQLFGRWLMLIDYESEAVLSTDNIESSLNVIYNNNLLEDEEVGFRGWANGMLPNKVPDMSGIHARTCWISAQLNLGSLFGDIGDEEKSLDVFKSIEKSFHNNHLAVGEWNRSINSESRAVVPEEAGKDTPRFPPYPRYKSAWEYLVRIIGLKIDWDYFYISPFKTIEFSFKNIILAGTSFDITVEKDWTCIYVNSEKEKLPIKLKRSEEKYILEFRKED